MKKNSAKFIFVSFLVIANLIFIRFASAEQIYYPYPIVFVHGLNSSDGMWIGMRDDLRQYFRIAQGVGEYKYPGQTSEMNYFIGCDYGPQSNGYIPTIAKDILSLKIDKALSYYPPEIPEKERKVIIVCHSMGGLVTRSLLTNISAYQGKIYRVVFIDTPHLGSSYASVLWLLNEINEGNGRMDPPPKKILYHSFGAFSSFPFNNKESVEYGIISYKILNTRSNIWWLLKLIGLFGGPKPAGEAVRDLRTPAFTSYNATYSGLLSGLTVTESKSYSSTDTFLGQVNLYAPSDFKVITGKNTDGWKITEWGLAKLLKFSSPTFTFSDLAGEPQTIDNAVVNGDGIVTMSSQEAVTMDRVGKADYQVNGFHVGIADNAINETLQAIEDDPVIEKIYAIPEKWNATPADDSYNSYYLIFKVKDYLLADIEIETLTIDGKSIIPGDFKNGKPYNAIGQAFLKERICNGKDSPKETAGYHDIYDDSRNNDNIKYPTLMPGEFFIKTKISQDAQSLYIKIKNPAAQYNSDLTNPDKFTAKKTFYFMRPKVSASWYYGIRYLFGTLFAYYGMIDVPPYHELPPDYDPRYGPATLCARDAPFYFYIEDSPSRDIKLNIWLYDENFVDIPRKFENVYAGIPWSSQREVTLPDGKKLILYSGGFDNDHTFPVIWHGEKDSGGTVPPDTNDTSSVPYNLKVTAGFPDPTMPVSDSIIVLLGSKVAGIAADPTFIQPSRRESVTW